MCGGGSNSTTIDYETNARSQYLADLDGTLKKFDHALVSTMNSYRDLLVAYDQVGQFLGSVAGTSGENVKQPIFHTRDCLREMKDKGPYVALNTSFHKGVNPAIANIKTELKKVNASLDELKKSQKEYDSIRAKVEKREAEAAKKGTALTTNADYKKDSAKRDTAKKNYETKKANFDNIMHKFQDTVDKTLTSAMNFYLHSNASMCEYMQVRLTTLRTNGSSDTKNDIDRMVDGLRQGRTVNPLAAPPAEN